MMLKTDSVFNIKWEKTCGMSDVIGSSICQTSDNGYCSTGTLAFDPMNNRELIIASVLTN